MKKEETRELISSLVLIFIQECMLQATIGNENG